MYYSALVKLDLFALSLSSNAVIVILRRNNIELECLILQHWGNVINKH